MSTPNPFAAPEPGTPGAGAPSSGTPGYGPPSYGAPGYGPPPPAYGAPAPPPGWYGAPKTDGTAIAVLVLAICSFVVFPVVPAIVALVLAPGAERNIAAAGGRLTGDGLVRAGRIVAWVHLGLFLAFLLVLVLAFGLLGAATFSA